jgi:WD40-like Beta Propeller Repeat
MTVRNRWVRRSTTVVTAAMIGWLIAGTLHAPVASAASTCPGRNGQLAVTVDTRVHDSEVIGVLTAGKGVRHLFSPQDVPVEAEFDQLSFSCDGSEIVYGLDNDSGCEELQIVSDRPGGRRSLRTPPICGRNPGFLSDGRIVFDGRRGTYMVDRDGDHLHRLFGEQVSANTANGRWFIAGGFRTLYLLNAKGQRVRRLAPALPPRSGEYLRPHFSPDGRWIVYEKTPEISTESRKGDLFIVRRDGTHLRRLTSGHRSSEAVFSPDGRWIAFIRSAGRGSRNVYELSVRDPSTVKALTHVRDANFYEPTWAPG